MVISILSSADCQKYTKNTVFRQEFEPKFHTYHVCTVVKGVHKVQMKFFVIVKFKRAAKIVKIAVYRFLISLSVPEL